MPAPLALADIILRDCGLTSAAVAPIAAALGRGFAAPGLRELDVSQNPELGSVGLTALVAVLPPTLEVLEISSTGCTDAAMAALADALPNLSRLLELHCSKNPRLATAGSG